MTLAAVARMGGPCGNARMMGTSYGLSGNTLEVETTLVGAFVLAAMRKPADTKKTSTPTMPPAI